MKGNSFHSMRQQSVRKILDSNDLNGILFSSLENIRYLCGFTGSDGTLLVTQKESFFLTDSRYWTQAEEEVKGCQIIHYKKKLDSIASLLLDLEIKRAGFESASLTFSSYRSLLEKLANVLELIPVEDEIKSLRSVKDAQELASIRKAIDIASNAFLHMIKMIKEGVIEREIALEMEFLMKRNGAEAVSFDIIVASGKRSALPHGKATDKKIEQGDLVLIDFGSEYQGYHSDQTRTVVCGNPSSEQKKVYQVVREAHDKAIEVIQTGTSLFRTWMQQRETISAKRDMVNISDTELAMALALRFMKNQGLIRRIKGWFRKEWSLRLNLASMCRIGEEFESKI